MSGLVDVMPLSDLLDGKMPWGFYLLAGDIAKIISYFEKAGYFVADMPLGEYKVNYPCNHDFSTFSVREAGYDYGLSSRIMGYIRMVLHGNRIVMFASVNDIESFINKGTPVDEILIGRRSTYVRRLVIDDIMAADRLVAEVHYVNGEKIGCNYY